VRLPSSSSAHPKAPKQCPVIGPTLYSQVKSKEKKKKQRKKKKDRSKKKGSFCTRGNVKGNDGNMNLKLDVQCVKEECVKGG